MIYFIGGAGRIKIGFTSGCPQRRLAQLQGANPIPLMLLGVLPGARSDERALHRQFAAHRKNNEWFSAHHEIEAYIRQNAQPAPAPARSDGRKPTEVGARVLILRKTLRMTQTRFGGLAGITQGDVASCESGLRDLSLRMGQALCDTYGVTLDWLYYGRAGGLSLQRATDLGILKQAA